MKIQDFDPTDLSASAKTTMELEVTRLPSGTPILFSTLVARGTEPGKTIVVIGGVHGDEYEGPLAILKTWEALSPAEMSGSFIGIPVVNPPAFDAGTRTSPIDEMNLARVFPGKADGTVSERIAHALLEYVFPHGDLLLDLHSGGVKYECPLTCGFYLLAGEIGRTSKEAALAFGADVVWGGQLNEGRTISEAVRHKQVPSIYTETTGGGGVKPDDLTAYVHGTQNVMKYLGILPGEPNAAPPRLYHESTEVGRDFDTAINCTQSGLWEGAVRSGEEVREGQLLGRIYATDGRIIEEIHSDRPGHVMGLRRFSRILAGELAALVV